MPSDNSRPSRRWSWAWLTKRWRTDGTRQAEADDRELVLRLAPSRIPSWKQARYLPRLLSPRERRWLRWCLSVAGLSLLVLVGHALTRHVIRVPANGGSLTEGLVGSPQYLNPILARPQTPDLALTRLLFRGLFHIDEQLRIVPDLAESLTVSADGKTYTVKLRPNLHWSDGEPITADDVRYTYETAADASYQSPVQSVFHRATVTAPDSRTVMLTLAESFEPLRSYLTLGLLPAHLWQDQTPPTFPLAELNLKPIGNGPYKFQSVTRDRNGLIKSFVLIRNTLFAGPRPKIDKLTIKMYPDPISAQDALTSSSIDSLSGLAPGPLAKVQPAHQVQRFALSQLTAVFFSQKTNLALRTKTVRQALALAVDRRSLITYAFGGVGRPADGPLLPAQPGYAADITRFGYDPAQANALLDQAGWKSGPDGFRAQGKQALSFALTTVDDPMYTAAADAQAASWKTIGAKVEVKIIPADRIQKDVIKPRQYDALLFGQISDVDADPYAFWHSSQQQGAGFALAVGYIKKVDSDVEAARTATTADAHQAALRDFQAVIADEVPAIILTQSEDLYAHQANLRGISANRIVTPADRFDGITSWYVKTRLSWK